MKACFGTGKLIETPRLSPLAPPHNPLAVTIDSLYKVTEGRQSDIFHRCAEGNFDPGCCFTIYHGNHMESLDVVTSNPEEARTWVTGLRYLMAGISDEDSLARRQRTHDQYPFCFAANKALPYSGLHAIMNTSRRHQIPKFAVLSG